MAATIKDVARHSGVSVATVSRALNGHPSVTDALRLRVRAAAAELRYTPHSGARSLITRRTDTVGVLLPDLHGEFFSELIRGIDVAARSLGLHLLVSSSHGDAAEAGAVLRAMQGRVDGVLVMSPYLDASVLAANLPPTFPLVLMNTPIEGSERSAVLVDNYGGAHAMVRHLVGCGRQRIAFITGPLDNLDARTRLLGYRNAMSAFAPGQVEQVLRGDFTEEGGYRAARQVLSMTVLPDAVFAANDIMAIGCLFAFGEAGVEVPRDIALVGFDDIPVARYITPSLTTVRVRIADLGGRALEQLVAAIGRDETSHATTETLRAELVVRASCGMHGHATAAPQNEPDSVSGKRARAGPDARRKPNAAPR